MEQAIAKRVEPTMYSHRYAITHHSVVEQRFLLAVGIQ
jgi:hypothetical protein